MGEPILPGGQVQAEGVAQLVGGQSRIGWTAGRKGVLGGGDRTDGLRCQFQAHARAEAGSNHCLGKSCQVVTPAAAR